MSHILWARISFEKTGKFLRKNLSKIQADYKKSLQMMKFEIFNVLIGLKLIKENIANFKFLNFIEKNKILLSFFILIIIYMSLYDFSLISFRVTIKKVIKTTLVAYPLYFLVTYIPDQRELLQRKKVTLEAYLDFKEEIITYFLFMTEGSACVNLIKKLCDPVEFEKFFSKDKWYKIHNSLRIKYEFQRVWKAEAHILKEELLALTSCKFSNPQSHQILKRFIRSLSRYADINLNDYDSQKSFMNFVAQLFCEWSFIDGSCRNFDLIKLSIKNL